jgi:hypothetical protein
VLRSLEVLRGYKLAALDGEIGKVFDFYFDDEHWRIRYLVAETGGWFHHRRVLIATGALGQPVWHEHSFPVQLTTEQVQTSPDVDTDKPVSRQAELAVSNHYGWPPYWTLDPLGIPVEQAVAAATLRRRSKGDPHLRSMNEVLRYSAVANDGPIGHLSDLTAEDQDWTIRYMAVDLGAWGTGKRVLLSPDWVESVSWADKEVRLGLSREGVRNSPEYDPTAPVNRAYEVRLYDYWGRPHYWQQESHGVGRDET